MSDSEKQEKPRKDWGHGPGPAGRCIPIGTIKNGELMQGNKDLVEDWSDKNFELQQFVHARDSLKDALRKIMYMPDVDSLIDALINAYHEVCKKIEEMSAECERIYIQHVIDTHESITKGVSEDA